MYTVTDADGSRNLHIEQALSELEKKFATIRKNKLEKREDLIDREQIYLCIFIASMCARTPRQREHMLKQLNLPHEIRLLETQMNDGAKQMEATPVEKTWSISKFIDEINSTTEFKSITSEQVEKIVQDPLRFGVRPMVELLTPLLLSLDFAILNTESKLGFITADHPVVFYCHTSQGSDPIFDENRLMRETIEVSMPISPKQCILLSRKNLNGYIDVPDDRSASEINKRSLDSAHRKFIVNQDYYDEGWYSYVNDKP